MCDVAPSIYPVLYCTTTTADDDDLELFIQRIPCTS